MKGYDGKLVGSLNVISEKECELIHDAAVRVLEEGGMRCEDERATRMFDKAGCALEEGGKLIKFPERVIMDALAQCPDSFVLHGRNDPSLDCAIGTGEVHFATMSGRYIEDFRTGERRQTRRQDAIEGTLIGDALENAHGHYKPVNWLYDEPKICNAQILVAEWMKNTNKTAAWTYNSGAENEIPDLVKIRGEYDSEQVVIIGVSLDRGAEEQVRPMLGKFVERFEINYPVLHDGQFELIRIYYKKNLASVAVPMTFVFDQQGQIYRTHVGVPRDKNGRPNPRSVLSEDIRSLLARS